MRRTILLFGSTVLLVMALVAGTSAPSVPTVRADNLLQGIPGLDGKRVYFTQSDNEASRFDRSDTGLSRLASLVQILGAELFTLEWQNGVPSDADLIVIAGPTRESQAEIAWLWSYLQNGGRLLLLVDPLYRVHSAQRGLFELTWAEMGFRARDDIVVTEGPMQVFRPAPERTREGTPTSTPAPSFEAPSLITDFTAVDLAQHPITTDIEHGLTFFGTRSLEVDETDFQDYLNGYGAEYNIDDDTVRTAQTLAVAIENTATEARIVLIGDREFATNGGGLQTSPPYSPSFLYPDNVRFLLNAIAWLMEADGEPIELSYPTPGPTATPTITPSPTPAPTSEDQTTS
jgi:hypothetical protein